MTMLVFALGATRHLGEQVATALNMRLSRHEERDFEDGEHKIRQLDNVRDRNVFVLHSLYSDSDQSVNDKICQLLFFIGALRDAGAGRITAVIPYFAYARKDRKTKNYDPVTMKYMAKLLEAVGTDQLISLDIHNLAAFQNAFRIPTEHLEAKVLFCPYLVRLVGNDKVVIVSPDAGGVKRAELFRQKLAALIGNDITKAFAEKKRSEGKVSTEVLVGDIQDRTAIIVDDIISSGTTMIRAVRLVREQGAKRIFAIASHGIFIGESVHTLVHSGLEKILVTDSIPLVSQQLERGQEKIIVLSTCKLIARAIQCLNRGNSISELLQDFPNLSQK